MTQNAINITAMLYGQWYPERHESQQQGTLAATRGILRDKDQRAKSSRRFTSTCGPPL
jgi:hypothetical protein